MTAGRVRVRRLAVVTLLLPLLVALVVGGVVALTPPSAGNVAAAATISPLPFDMPSVSTLQASGKKVFAHYVPTLPISMDNKDPQSDYYQRNYISPTGEGGRHSAYGGWLRDRPLTRSPLAGDWRYEDLKTEVRRAISAGIDGFTVVIYTMPTSATDPGAISWQAVKRLMDASREVDPDFKIIPMPDVSGDMVGRSVQNMAMNMATLAKYPSAQRLGDGRVVISPYSAESHPASWWASFNNIMASTYGQKVALLPLLFNETGNRAAFAPISYGLTTWGSRAPAGNNPSETSPSSPVGRIGEVHKLGKTWMQAVSMQDSRPRSGIFEEAENTTNLRNTWEIAIKGKADWVQLATWGDYPENSQLAPTVTHGWTPLDISAYYATWYKTGTAPKIVRDVVYLTNRKHPVAAKPTYPQSLLMKVKGASPARDTVEALTFLTAPATVRVQVGSKQYLCAAQAGIDTCTVPLGTGKVSAAVVRSGVVKAGTTAAGSVTNTPYVQDMKYQAVSSGREPSLGANSVAITSTTAVPRTLGSRPTADTYVDENAPSVNYYKSSQLVSRGKKGAVSYLRFPVPKAPAGMAFQSASVTFRTSTASGAGSIDSHPITLAGTSWSESTLTWKNRLATNGARLGTIPARTGVNAATTVTLSPTVVKPLVGGTMNVAISSSGSDNLILWSTGHGSINMHPLLKVTFTPTSGTTPVPNPTPTAPAPTPTPTPTTAPVSNQTITLTPTADTYADENGPTKNFGWSSQVFSRGSKGAASYLKFNVPTTPAGKTLKSAQLKYRTTTASDAGSTSAHQLTVVSSSWSESTLTWRNRPAATTQSLGTISGGTKPNTAYAAAVSPSLLQQKQGTAMTVAITSTGTDNLRLWSTGHESRATHPQLVLTYG